MLTQNLSRTFFRRPRQISRIQLLGRFISKRSSRGLSRNLSTSPWAEFEMAPVDPIVGLNEIFQKDEYPSKVIVGVGAYRNDFGKPYVLPCVREAEKILMDRGLDMEYTGIAGEPKFVDLALEFVYGNECVPMLENRVRGTQALSGTGGLRVFGEMMRKHGHKHIYVPNPTWGNHIPIFNNAGLEVRKYRYYDSEISDLDFTGLIGDIKSMPEGSIILLHACAHNPTGMDPTIEQWKEISDTIKERKLLPFFDCAYQGFATGDPVKDAAAVRLFIEDDHLISMVQSFSKNFGLYGQRIGALSIVGRDEDEAKRVVSQMKKVIRPMYSNPPRQGARIVTTILEDPRLTQDFLDQCKGMADRISMMRALLRKKLAEVGSTKNWGHITKQIGMFAYSGLSSDQVMKMREIHHLYCTADGRISMAGVTSENVDYIANAIHDVSK